METDNNSNHELGESDLNVHAGLNGDHDSGSELNSKRSLSAMDVDLDSQESIPHTEENEEDSEHSMPPNPLGVLIRAAQLMNPQQFSIPPDFLSTVPIPGVSKRIPQATSRSKKLPHELDNGLVPLPVKTCYFCNRSCKKAPLIQVSKIVDLI